MVSTTKDSVTGSVAATDDPAGVVAVGAAAEADDSDWLDVVGAPQAARLVKLAVATPTAFSMSRRLIFL